MPKIILLTDTPDYEYLVPTLSLQEIQSCLHALQDDIPPSDQLHALQQVVQERHPNIAERLLLSSLNLLHLILYIPGDIYDPLSELLSKCPQAAHAADCTRRTPLHHAITSTRHNMTTRCYDLLLRHSPDEVVNHAIKSNTSPWHEVKDVVTAKVNGLRVKDEESGMMPFMLAAEGNRGEELGLTAVYELLCLQPSSLKEYVHENDEKLPGDSVKRQRKK